MTRQIANPVVVDNAERLARASGLSRPAAVDSAAAELLHEAVAPPKTDVRMAAILTRFDNIPDRDDAFDPLCWDKHGLP